MILAKNKCVQPFYAILVAILFALLSFPALALSATVPCDGGDPNDDNWSSPLKWDGDVLPGSADDAVIPDLSGTVEFNATATVNTLTVSGTSILSATGGNLTINSTSSIFNLIITGAGTTISGTGMITITKWKLSCMPARKA